MKSTSFIDIDQSFFNNNFKIIEANKEKNMVSKECSNNSLNISKETINVLSNSLSQSECITNDIIVINNEETILSHCHNTKKNDQKCKLSTNSIDIIESSEIFNDIDDCDEINAEDLDEIFDCDWNIDSQINLNSFQRCDVIDLQKNSKSMILKVQQHTNLKTFATVTCSGFW